MIKNWQHICIFSRMASQNFDLNGETIYHDGRTIVFKIYGDEPDSIDDDYRMHCIDADTGEVLLTIDHSGFPCYKSAWADSEPSEPYQIA